MCSKIFRTAIYTRLSKDDGEGNSILNQKQLIKRYLKNIDNIEICLEIEDYGVSGVNFFREGFEKLLDEIKKGNINCVVVKDLSRFGRNYIEVGDYLEKIFPLLNVRFIAINDNYDSINENDRINDILVPFKNLINESYLRDTSIKIRSQFQTKRENGDFIGAFCCYGYKKDNHNKNKLVIDKYASKVVAKIFKWKIKGYSNKEIANKLNTIGEWSPYEYRKVKDKNFTATKNGHNNAKWQEGTVFRILQNDVYNGVLTQGKVTTLNYKLKKVIKKKKATGLLLEIITKIIDDFLFNTVQKLMLLDTRVAPKQKILYLFSNFLFCGDCGSSMCRKTVTFKHYKYYYWVCSNNKMNKICSAHSFKEEKLYSIVKTLLHNYIYNITDFNILENIVIENENEHTNSLITMKENELFKIKKYKMCLYEDFKNNILTKSEYENYSVLYNEKLSLINNNLKELALEQKENSTFKNNFRDIYKNIELSRNILLFLIDKIKIYDNNEININFLFKDKLKMKSGEL